MRRPRWLSGRSHDPDRFARWSALLARDVALWATLSLDERTKLLELVDGFVARTGWEAARGFAVDERVQVVVAAQACLMLLGLDLDGFPRNRTVIVHRSTVVLGGRRSLGLGSVESSDPFPVLGQTHYEGPILLSWAAVLAGSRRPERGHNVVIHEFAHALDMIDGTIDGTPPLDDPEARARWIAVCTRAYDQVRLAEEPSVLRPYAGVNPGEFFAVASEVFFTRPVELREHEPDLYRELAAYFRQDPATRTASAAPGTVVP